MRWRVWSALRNRSAAISSLASTVRTVWTVDRGLLPAGQLCADYRIFPATALVGEHLFPGLPQRCTTLPIHDQLARSHGLHLPHPAPPTAAADMTRRGHMSFPALGVDYRSAPVTEDVEWQNQGLCRSGRYDPDPTCGIPMRR